MGGQINCYNLGKLGVNVDKSPLELEDGELLAAQNAIRDPLGLAGAIRKRPGLAAFNGSSAAGSVLGGIGVPITFSNPDLAGGSFGGITRTLYVGRTTKIAGLGVTDGWVSTTDIFASAATGIAAGSGPPASPRAKQTTDMDTTIYAYASGMPAASAVIGNKLFYAANNYVSGTDAPPIRVFDGTNDTELTRLPKVPYNGVTNHSVVNICSMLAANGFLYVSAHTTDNTGTTFGGYVYEVDPTSGAVRQLGAEFPTNYIPYALAWHSDRLWVGTNFRGGTGTVGSIHRMDPAVDTNWVTDRNMANGRGVGILISYGGQLFAGAWGGSTNDVEVRSTLGAWSSSLSVASGSASFFTGACIYKNNLYVAHWVEIGSIVTIRKFDGTSWSTVYTNSGGTNACFLSTLFVVGTTLVGVGGGNNFGPLVLTSTDGASYTDRTANVTASRGYIATFGALTT